MVEQESVSEQELVELETIMMEMVVPAVVRKHIRKVAASHRVLEQRTQYYMNELEKTVKTLREVRQELELCQ